MVQRSPLVIVNGRLSELPPGDSIDGAVTGIVTAGSGLVGGGDLNTGSKRLDVALEANASGLIYVGDSIGYDGVAETTAAEALASGLAGLSDSVEALASGNEALEFSQEALVSGNAALAAAVNSTSFTNSVTLTAASDLSPGTPVGLNAIGEVEAVVEISGSSTALKANSPSVFANATIDYLVTDYSTKSGKGLIVYEETVPLYARTIEVVGNQAVLSEPITLSSGALAGLYPSVAYSEIDDKFLTIFRDAGAGTFLSSRVVMISGDSLFAGPARTAGDAAVENTALAYHPTLNGFIGHYEQTSVDDTTGFYILNSFSAASGIYTLNSANNVTLGLGDQTWKSNIYDKRSGSGILVYADTNSSNHLSAGVEYLIDSASASLGPYPTGVYNQKITTVVAAYIDTCYIDSVDCVLATYEADSLGGDPGYSVCLTVSGLAVEYGDFVPFTDTSPSGDVMHTSCAYDKQQQRAVVLYRGDPSNYLRVSTGVPSGATLSGQYNIAWDTAYVLDSIVPTWTSLYYDDKAKRTVACYWDTTNAEGRVTVLSPDIFKEYSAQNLYNQNNFLGLSTETVSSGDSCTVLLPQGSLTTFSGLETGRFYYLDAVSGQLTTEPIEVPSWSGATNWKPVGKALSSTTMFLLNDL